MAATPIISEQFFIMQRTLEGPKALIAADSLLGLGRGRTRRLRRAQVARFPRGALPSAWCSGRTPAPIKGYRGRGPSSVYMRETNPTRR